jgi:hypothetical protein
VTCDLGVAGLVKVLNLGNFIFKNSPSSLLIALAGLQAGWLLAACWCMHQGQPAGRDNLIIYFYPGNKSAALARTHPPEWCY